MPFLHKIPLLFATLCISVSVSAQNYIPDAKGYVVGPAFQKLIKSRGYQLVTKFDTVSRKPLKLAAKAIKNGEVFIIDTKGEELKEADRPTPVRIAPGSGFGDITIEGPVEDKKELFEQANDNGKVGTKNKATKKIGLPVIYNEIVWEGNGLLTIKLDGKMGLAKTDGTVLLKPTYESISVFDLERKANKMPRVWRVYDNKKYGLLNKDFKETIPPKFDYILNCYGCDVSNNLAVVTLNKKNGLMTVGGKELLPPEYDQIKPIWLRSAPILIMQGRKEGLADSLGNITIPPTMDQIRYQQEDNTIMLMAGNRYGAAGLDGKVIAQPIYGSIRAFENGMSIVEKDDKYGLISKTGALVIPAEYDFIYRTGNFVIAEKDKMRGLLNLAGKIILPFEYQSLAIAGNGFFFKKNEVFGIMDSKGKLVTKLDYQDVQYANSYLIVKKDGKYGVANSAGKLIIPAKYDGIRSNSFFLQDGTAGVTLNGRKGVVDLYGNELFRDR